jgi:hypothetical protein
MHPFLLRGCWIESATRNGSGNGGAALLGFVLMVRVSIFPVFYSLMFLSRQLCVKLTPKP